MQSFPKRDGPSSVETDYDDQTHSPFKADKRRSCLLLDWPFRLTLNAVKGVTSIRALVSLHYSESVV